MPPHPTGASSAANKQGHLRRPHRVDGGINPEGVIARGGRTRGSVTPALAPPPPPRALPWRGTLTHRTSRCSAGRALSLEDSLHGGGQNLTSSGAPGAPSCGEASGAAATSASRSASATAATTAAPPSRPARPRGPLPPRCPRGPHVPPSLSTTLKTRTVTDTLKQQSSADLARPGSACCPAPLGRRPKARRAFAPSQAGGGSLKEWPLSAPGKRVTETSD